MGFSVTDLINKIGTQSHIGNISNSFNRATSLLSSNRTSSLTNKQQEISSATAVQSRSSTVSSSMLSISDNLSKTAIADNALGKVSDITDRMSKLAKQSASESMSDSSRSILNSEYQDLRKEIDKISEETTYNDSKLLDGSGSISMAIGNTSTSQSQYNNYSLREISADSLGLAADISTKENAEQGVAQLDNSSNIINNTKGELASVKDRLTTNLEVYNSLTTNTAAGSSRIIAPDLTEDVSLSTRASVLQQTGTAMLAQANVSSQQVMQLLR